MKRFLTQLHKKHALAALLLCLGLLCTGCRTDSSSTAETTLLTTALTTEMQAPLPTEPDTIVDAADTAYSYEDMQQDLAELVARYPTLLTLSSIGQSCDGRELYCAMLGRYDAPATVMIQGGIHGREYLTPQLIMCQLEYYLIHYESEYATVFSNLRFCVLPMVNPDGVMISQEGFAAIRSPELRQGVEAIYFKDVTTSPDLEGYFGNPNGYLRLWKANARGVDLNRNFGIDGWDQIKSRSYPSLLAYKGPSANSEPETRALMALTESLEGLICSVSYHSQGEIIYWDSGQEGDVRRRSEVLTELAATLTGYKKQDTFTAPDGTYNDWSMLNCGIPSIILETGLGDCPLPHEQLSTILSQNLLLWHRIAEQVALLQPAA